MATTEHIGLMTTKDSSGNTNLLYPITKAKAVDGIENYATKVEMSNASVASAVKDGNGNVIANTYVTKDQTLTKNDSGGISIGTDLRLSGYDQYTLKATLAFSINASYEEINIDGNTCYGILLSPADSATTAFINNNGLNGWFSDNYGHIDYGNLSSYESPSDGFYIEDPQSAYLVFSDESTASRVAGEVNVTTVYTVKGYEVADTVYPYQTIFGEYNSFSRIGNTTNSSTPLLIVGNGTGSAAGLRKNAMRLCRSNGLYLGTGGNYNSSGADYGEYWEWLDGNVDNEDRRGKFVTLVGDKIQLANPGDFVLGAISRNACIIGNADEEWTGRWLKDDFGEILYETVTDEDGNLIEQPIQNPEYDPNLEYIPRSERQEWDVVGMFGVIIIVDNGACEVNSYATVGEGGIAIPADENSECKFRVISRVSDNIIRIVYR